MVAFLADGCFAEPHRPVPVVRVEMVGPERGLGQPAVHRVAEDALCLLAHEGELEARHVRFPDDSLDRVDQIPESLLRGYRFGESRAFAFQQSLPIVVESLPFADVFDRSDESGRASRLIP